VAVDSIYTQSGAFVPTNYLWDIQQLESGNLKEDEFRLLLVRLYQNINNIALVLNMKDTGMYNTSQFVTSQQFFPNPALNSSTPQVATFRQAYRILINFGALPNAGTKSVPHGITCTSATTVTRIYGAATDPVSPFSYIPLPYASATAVADNIELYADGTNINVTTGANYSAYTTTYIIFEFLQN
jgi:hypothetical protein